MPGMMPPLSTRDPHKAVAAASAAAKMAGIHIAALDTAAAAKTAEDLLASIWRAPAGSSPVSSDLIRALWHADNYVFGAYVDKVLVGVSVAFFTGERPSQLHSHISGIDAQCQGRCIGFALKLHQRAWALGRGLERVSWTMDPLVRRNVFFNLAKLGADVVAYLPDFYGGMDDGVNAGDQSDRFLVSWFLTDDRVVAACGGRSAVDKGVTTSSEEAATLLSVGPGGAPIVGHTAGTVLYCMLPPDIVRLRSEAPALARAWRMAVRDALIQAMREGYRVAGVTRDGALVLRREQLT